MKRGTCKIERGSRSDSYSCSIRFRFDSRKKGFCKRLKKKANIKGSMDPMSEFRNIVSFLQNGLSEVDYSWAGRGEPGCVRSGRGGPVVDDANDLIDGERDDAEHEMAFDLERAADAEKSGAELHEIVEIGDAGARHGHQGNGDLAVVDGGRGQHAGDRDLAAGHVDVEFVPGPGLFVALAVFLAADVAGGGQVG